MLDCCQVSQSTYVGKPDYIVVGLSSLVHSWCNDRTAHSGPATGCGGSKAGKTSDVCRLPNAWRDNNVSQCQHKNSLLHVEWQRKVKFRSW